MFVTLEEHLRRIIEVRRRALRVSRHFEEKATERGLDVDHIRELFSSGNCVACVQQNRNRFKLVFEHTRDKDLSIIVDLHADAQVDLVTVFPSKIERRLR